MDRRGAAVAVVEAVAGRADVGVAEHDAPRGVGTEALELIRPDWPAPDAVFAASTTRLGGVSHGPFASLNLASHVGDAPADVALNRARLGAVLGEDPAALHWLEQVHGRHVVRLPRTRDDRLPADACWTDRAGVTCAVLTADCLPVLLCDADARVVAAAHAGWRGLAAGVLEATVAALPVAPERLMAWIGPAIGVEAFEVGDEVRDTFLTQDAGAQRCFVETDRAGKWHCDLSALAVRRLRAVGVARVSESRWCCHRDAPRFFSYRRDGVTGRFATLIRIVSTPYNPRP